MRHILLYLLLAGGLASCSAEFFNQESDAYQIPFEHKLVLHALLTPQDPLIIVDVRLNEPATGLPSADAPLNGRVTDAEVMFFGPQDSITLPYFQCRGVAGYAVPAEDFTLTPGTVYQIEARWNGLLATGSLRIPDAAPSPGTIALDIYESEENDFPETIVQTTIANLPGEEDHYLIYHDIEDLDSTGTVTSRQRDLIDYLRGTDRQGNRLIFKEFGFRNESRNILRICTIEPAYFRYLDTRFQGSLVDENPFAEPVNVFTNVEGGLGVVAGGNCLKIILQ